MNSVWAFSFGTVVVAVVLALLIAVTLVAVVKIPGWQARRRTGFEQLDAQTQFSLENEARRTIVEIVGGAILIVGLFFTWNAQQQEHKRSNKGSSRNKCTM